jgi:hypothetical protein
MPLSGVLIVHLLSNEVIGSKPLQNAPFCPISVSGSNFNPQNTKFIPAVKIFAFPSGA